MRILLDNGVLSSANFLEPASKTQVMRWGQKSTTFTIAGFRRVAAVSDEEQQREIDALFTVGRLAREKKIELFTYSELMVERWRRPRGTEPCLNAFMECQLSTCPSPLERSRFRTTINMDEWISKSDKRDHDKGRPVSEMGQVPYFEWLATLPPEHVQSLLHIASDLKLQSSDIKGLRDLQWFQSLYQALGSSDKHLPDCFHLWTARRNSLDSLLTLEKKLPRSIDQLKRRRQLGFSLDVSVQRPTELIMALGLSKVDPVLIDFDRFYSFGDVLALQRTLLRAE